MAGMAKQHDSDCFVVSFLTAGHMKTIVHAFVFHNEYSQVKEEIMEIVSFLRDPQRFLTLGARSPAGVLLVGAPGARWLATSHHAVAAICALPPVLAVRSSNAAMLGEPAPFMPCVLALANQSAPTAARLGAIVVWASV